MRIDRIAIALRLRDPWEAIDLGAVMIRAWWRPLYAAWFAVVLPLALALHLVFANAAWIALLLLWWLKPAYDRIVLFVLAQAVFGSPPGVRATIAGLLSLVRSTGLPAALTWRRLDPLRSFNLPVRQLEGQRGAAARTRERLLGRRAAGQATGLMFACIAFEIIVLLSLNLSLDLLTPAGMGANEPTESILAAAIGFGDEGWRAHLRNAFYFLALCIVEPLYVAGGFALYLNRRTALEAWDLELAFRRMRPDAAPRSLLGFAIGALFACTIAASAQPAWTAERTADSGTIIREVLAAPDFQEFSEKAVWRLRRDSAEATTRGSRPAFMDFLLSVAETLSQLSRVAAYAIIALVVAVLLLYLYRAAVGWSRAPPTAPADRRPPPAILFGLDVRPESLPDDLARLAARAASQDPRMALSLLYRGALAALIHRDGIRIDSGDTEGDCLRRVRRANDPTLTDYFARLVGAWSQAAYAVHRVDPALVQALCEEWPRFFGAPAGNRA